MSELREQRRAWSSPLLLIAILACVSLMCSFGGVEVQAAATIGLVYLVVVVALFVFVGTSGVVSFGHIGFMGLGAYASAILAMPPARKAILLPSLPEFLMNAHLPTLITIPIAGVFCGVVAAVAAIPLMRLSGLAAGIGTLALLVIVQDVLNNATSITGGVGTLTGVPVTTGVWTACAWACLATLVGWLFHESRTALHLRSAREDEPAARSLGIGVLWERSVAFVLSAVLTGIGGALFGHFVGSFSQAAFFLPLTFLTLTMLVLGGQRSVSGAVLGVIVVSVLAFVLDRLEMGRGILGLALGLPSGSRQIALAALLIVVLARRPDGLMSGRDLRVPSLFKARRSPSRTVEPGGAALRAGPNAT